MIRSQLILIFIAAIFSVNIAFANTTDRTNIHILCEDIPESGFVSAYKSYTFYIETVSGIIENPTWILSMPLADGTMECLKLENQNLTCTISPLQNEDRYKISEDGIIDAKLEFSCTVDGVEEKAFPFNLHLELMPYIEYAVIEKIVDNSPFDSYDAYYKVKYWGSDKIKVSVEEEYSSIIYVKYIYEPYEAYGVADHITNQFHAWIDFTVENQYGEALYTIELGPNGEVMGIDNIEEDADEHFNVYDVKGNYIGSYAGLEEISGLRVKGILIVRHFKSGKMVNTFKMAHK